jgi:hypothetical protein
MAGRARTRTMPGSGRSTEAPEDPGVGVDAASSGGRGGSSGDGRLAPEVNPELMPVVSKLKAARTDT